ncbi:vomeronasal type-2 receptor 26-like [Eleutherodactylus coqui]|uniref:vomeronasal type-2 receptor 26-like n=1 Tax=Eleutherodactylus coqui TaxID=57060 RepID=UPI003461AF53
MALRNTIQNDLKSLTHHVNSSVLEVNNRLNNTENKMEELVKSHNELIDAHYELEGMVTKLQNKLMDVEDRNRRNNIKIHGVPEKVSNAEISDYVTSLIRKVLPNLSEQELKIDRAHRISLPRFLKENSPRDIIVRIHYYSTKEVLMNTARKLKTLPSPYSDIRLFIDLSEAIMEARRRFAGFCFHGHRLLFLLSCSLDPIVDTTEMATKLLSLNANGLNSPYKRRSVWKEAVHSNADILIYGVTDPILYDRTLYPTIYQFGLDDGVRFIIIATFLRDRGWNWVELIIASKGCDEVRVKQLLDDHKICIEYIINLGDKEKAKREISKIDKSTAEVVVICGSYSAGYADIIRESKALIDNKTLILDESWIDIIYRMQYDMMTFINCSLVFMVPIRTIVNVEKSINNVNPTTRPNDPLLEEILFEKLKCLTKDKRRNHIYQRLYNCHGVNCTEMHYIPQTKFKIRDRSLYYTYVSVYVVAQAIHTIIETGNESSTQQIQQRFNKYMKYVNYIDPDGEEITFNDKGQVRCQLCIVNWILHKTKISETFLFTSKPITIMEKTSEGNQQIRFKYSITWKKGQFIFLLLKEPQSRCNDRCSPGYRKRPNGGYHVCCYDCVPCSEGEVSNITDIEICYKCPEEEWHDEKKVKCVPKLYEFLSYEKDILVDVFSALALSLCAVTLFISGLFIYYWDTPIVKANNRTVSFLLLVSIFLSFLCVFFFIGHPVHITCLLRQTLFGILFSVGISSVLAKTVTVCIAFKATKPGSSLVKFVSFKVSSYVVLVCSSVQVLICAIWLFVSPPYVEFDHHTYPGKIIIQCNEGSDIWFYSMLGYMGLLASVSFVLAFMVRTLPDSFNEAKYITFSMLLFCSVWITMIPAYLSTRGKYMVVVEIFAILTSCAGVLGSCRDILPDKTMAWYYQEMRLRTLLVTAVQSVLNLSLHQSHSLSQTVPTPVNLSKNP